MVAIRELNLEKKKNDINLKSSIVNRRERIVDEQNNIVKRTKIVNGKPFIVYSHFSANPASTPLEQLFKVIDTSL